MSGWDAGAITYSNQELVAGDAPDSTQLTRQSVKHRFREFIRNFRQGNNFLYRNQLLQRWRKRDFHMTVDLQDVLSYDSELNDLIQRSPNDYVPLFEQAAKDALKVRCAVCGVRRAVCGVRCAVCGVRCAACGGSRLSTEDL